MPILSEETYEEMWEISREYNGVLEEFQEEWEIDVDEVYDALEGHEEDIDEAINALQDVALIVRRTGGENREEYFRITSLGFEALSHEEKEDYLETMEEMESRFEEAYSE